MYIACGEIYSYQFYTVFQLKISASSHLHLQNKGDYQVRYDFFLVDFLHETLKENVARFLNLETQAGFENYNFNIAHDMHSFDLMFNLPTCFQNEVSCFVAPTQAVE